MIFIEYASRGIGTAGLTTGIIGTVLGAAGSGIVPALLGGGNCHPESMPVSRYDAQKDARIAELETEVKLRDANTFTMGEMNKMRNYVDSKLECINSAINQQAVYNATNTSTIACLSNQVAQLMALTKCVIPTTSICPEPMLKYNSWTAPTAGA